jgi:hypothetical protein
MVLTVERHQAGLGNQGREIPAFVELDERIALSVEDQRRHRQLSCQGRNVNFVQDIANGDGIRGGR